MIKYKFTSLRPLSWHILTWSSRANHSNFWKRKKNVVKVHSSLRPNEWSHPFSYFGAIVGDNQYLSRYTGRVRRWTLFIMNEGRRHHKKKLLNRNSSWRLVHNSPREKFLIPSPFSILDQPIYKRMIDFEEWRKSLSIFVHQEFKNIDVKAKVDLSIDSMKAAKLYKIRAKCHQQSVWREKRTVHKKKPNPNESGADVWLTALPIASLEIPYKMAVSTSIRLHQFGKRDVLQVGLLLQPFLPRFIYLFYFFHLFKRLHNKELFFFQVIQVYCYILLTLYSFPKG